MKSSIKRFIQALSPLLALFVHGLLYVLPYLFILFFPIVLTGFLMWKLGIRDSVGGIIISELIFRFVLQRLEQTHLFQAN